MKPNEPTVSPSPDLPKELPLKYKRAAIYDWKPYDLPKYFQSKTHINWDGAGTAFSGPSQIRIVKDSAIWISITPAFGIEAARVLALPDSIHLLDRINRKHTARSYESLRAQFPLPISFRWLQAFLLRYPFPYTQPNSASIKYSDADSTLLITDKQPSFFEEMLFGKGAALKSSFRVTQPQSDTLLLEWGEPKIIQGTPLSLEPKAKLSALDSKNTRQYFNLELKYTKPEFTINYPKMQFVVPDHYERIR